MCALPFLFSLPLDSVFAVSNLKTSSVSAQVTGSSLYMESESTNFSAGKKRKAVADNKVHGQSPEKRLRRFCKSCPDAVSQRIERALAQRLYLVQKDDICSSDGEKEQLGCNFVVLGSTGNVYTVRIAHEAECDCPDHQRTNSLCKHILFVLLKVIRLPPDSPLVYQNAWLTSELQEMFALLADRRVGGSAQQQVPLANQKVRALYAKLQSGEDVSSDTDCKVARKSLEEDSDCPICFDSMADGESLAFCRAMCGANFHSSCIDRWSKSQSGSCRKPTTCPNCRQPWESTSAAGVCSAEGYANLGRVQGQSPNRDTTYYRGRKRGRSYF